MKRLITIVLISAACITTATKTCLAAPPPGSVSFQGFYDGLGAYGSWTYTPAYGYVWVPAAGPGFIPYCSGGHWDYSDNDGWIWVSDYAWGWAPFHYGRWYYDDGFGWAWVPGYEWAPSWVVWGSCNGYYGWAPLTPGVAFYAGYHPPMHYWTFVPEGRVTEVNIYNVRVQNNVTVVGNVSNVHVISNSKTYSSARYFSGPNPAEVQKATGKPVKRVSIAESAKPGATSSGNQLAVYRPSITKDPHTAPAKPVKAAEIKSSSKATNAKVVSSNPNGASHTPAAHPAATTNHPPSTAAKPATAAGNRPKEAAKPAQPVNTQHTAAAKPVTPANRSTASTPPREAAKPAPAQHSAPPKPAAPVNRPKPATPTREQAPRPAEPATPHSEPAKAPAPEKQERPNEEAVNRPMSPPLRETRPYGYATPCSTGRG